MLVGAHPHEDRDPDVDLAAIQKGDAGADDAGLLQVLDTAPAGRGRKPHPLRDLRNRHGGVLLQNPENPTIDLIEHIFL